MCKRRDLLCMCVCVCVLRSIVHEADWCQFSIYQPVTGMKRFWGGGGVQGCDYNMIVLVGEIRSRDNTSVWVGEIRSHDTLTTCQLGSGKFCPMTR